MSAERFEHYDELSERREATKATSADVAAMKRQAKTRDAASESAYKAGLADATRNRHAKARGTVSKKAAKHVKSATRPIRAGAKQGIRDVQAPVQAQVRGGIRTLTLTLCIVALYLFLTSVDTVTGVLGGFTRALKWLQDSGKSIPYAN